MGLSQNNFIGLLSALTTVLDDTLFIKQILAINANINTIAEDN